MGKFASSAGMSPTASPCLGRTMVSQLVKHERIETNVAKVKEVRRKADLRWCSSAKRHTTYPTPVIA